MSDFMTELLKSVRETPNKVDVKAIQMNVDSKIESTQFIEGEKVKQELVVTEEKKQIEPKFVQDRPLYLSVDLGGTINLGNYNMGKVSVSLSMPVGTEITPELLTKLDDSYSFAKKFCETRLAVEVQELSKMKGKL